MLAPTSKFAFQFFGGGAGGATGLSGATGATATTLVASGAAVAPAGSNSRRAMASSGMDRFLTQAPVMTTLVASSETMVPTSRSPLFKWRTVLVCAKPDDTSSHAVASRIKPRSPYGRRDIVLGSLRCGRRRRNVAGHDFALAPGDLEFPRFPDAEARPRVGDFVSLADFQ